MRFRLWLLMMVMGLLCGCTSHYYAIQKKEVYVYLKAPEANDISYATSADGFQLHAVKADTSGHWYFRAPSQPEFKYFYVVDGEIYLPACKYRETDDFGGQNCIYVPARETGL